MPHDHLPLTARLTPRFAAGLERWGDDPALLLSDTGEVVTYAELAKRADAFAARLGRSVRFLSVEMTPVLEPICAYLGALRAGVPVLLHGGGASAGALLSAIPPDASFVREDGWILHQAPWAWKCEPAPELALLLSTSGTTGEGRLVRLSGANLQANADSICEYLGLTAADRAISSLPFSYSYGLSVLNSHLNVGGSIVLTDCSVSAPEFGPMLQRWGVTGLAGVPYSYELMQRSDLLEALPASVGTLTQAGGRMAPELIRYVADVAQRGGQRLFVMYGQTEATARMAYLPPAELSENVGNIGRAIPGGRLWVEGEDGEPAAAGDEGELVYEGPNVMLGYATSREDFSAPPGPTRLRTGDLGREVSAGMFQITGRKSRFVKLYGLRVGLDALETRLEEAGATARLAGDDEFVAIAVTDAESLAVAREVIATLRLPAACFEFLHLAEFPQLSNGKADYRQLQALARVQRERATPRSPLTQVEQLFAALANGREVTDADSFERLGGDSLSYVEGAIAIEEALGHLPEAWWRLTLGELRALAPGEAASASAPQKSVSVETDTLVRSLAILAVVVLHAGAHLRGGADVLMMLAGYNWSRFQRVRLLNGEAWRVFRDFLVRYVSVFISIVCLVSLENWNLEWRYLLFISNYVDGRVGIMNIYWFLECLTWIVGLVCLLSLFPAARRFAGRRPVWSGLALVALGLVVRLAGSGVVTDQGAEARRPDQMLVYFAVGWAFASTSSKLLRGVLIGLLCILSALWWPMGDTHVLLMALAGGLMIATPRVRLPRRVASGVLLLSAASFYVYLLDIFPMHLGDQVLHAPHKWFWPINVSLALGLGVGAYKLRGWVADRWPAALRWLRALGRRQVASVPGG